MDNEEEKKTPETEVTKETPSEDDYNYLKDSKKSMAQLAKDESRRKSTKAKEVVEEKEVVKEEPKEVKKEEPVVSKPDPVVEDLRKELAETKKAQERLQEDLKKVEESKLPEAQKTEEKKVLRSKWQEENRTPKDYDEILEEAKRITKEELREELKAEEEKKAEASRAKTDEEKRQEQARLESERQYRETVEKDVQAEYAELEREGVVAKITDWNNPEDLGVQEMQKVFQKALEINTERVKQGQPMITSISRIYYNHYKPSQKNAQPAGADAPIAGARTSPSQKVDESAWTPADRKKSFAQIARELLRR